MRLKREYVFSKIQRTFSPSNPIFSVLKGYLPSWVTVEPTNLCNLHCEFCSWDKLKRPKGFLSYERFCYLIEQIPTLKRIALFFMGEPFLNTEIFDMISYVERRGIEVTISTNSTLLSKLAYKIVESGLSNLEVCLDGLTQDTLGKYRKGANYSNVALGIKTLCRLRETKPKVILRFLVFRHNEPQVEGVVRLAKDLGVALLRLGLPLLDFNSPCVDLGLVEEWCAKNPEYRRYDERGCLKNQLKNCPSVWTPTITWDGHVLPCCIDVDAKYRLGNVFEQSFKEIYWSDRYSKIRKLMWTKKLPLCKECTLTSKANVELELN